MQTTLATPSIDDTRLYARITRRLVPFLFLCYVAAYLDRVNISFAKLTMSAALEFSDTVYGLGAGIFFIGYFLFEIPSNLLMQRIGARATMARIMVLWGLVSAGTCLVQTPTQFYVMRFLLGLAEAGFFPGVVLYLTYWFPAERRGRVMALFVTAVAVSGAAGSPLSGWLMKTLDGLHGVAGWQWLLLVEGLPSVVLGLLAWRWLDDRVEDARWLSAAERAHVLAAIEAEAATKAPLSALDALRDRRVWLLAAIYFCIASGLYGVNFWLPTIVKSLGVTDLVSIGLVSAVPWIAAMGCMTVIGQRADRRRERRFHVALPALAGAAGLLASVPLHDSPVLAIAALTVGMSGILTALPLSWSLSTAFLGGAGAASGIALINAIGNLSGFVSPYLVGYLRDLTGHTDDGLFFLAGLLVAGALLVVFKVPAALVNR